MIETDPVIKEFRLKALESSLEINKGYPESDCLNRIVGQAIVIEHYLATGSLLGDDTFPKYAH
ncbi:MAG: hypothetical protein LBQ88_08695 [Treponema sp.]|jgi:hypothetical protein|nr:hypothetical protein [Treponema sp.]